MAIDTRARRAWVLYDFANSAFTTLVVTFIFATFFTQRIADDPTRGTILWSRAVNLSSLILALSVPFLGAMADRSSRRKLFLLVTTAMCVAATAALGFAGPGDVIMAMTLFVIANVGFEAANVFYNSFLPDVATESDVGRVSGRGWAVGYLGGLSCLVIALVMVSRGIPASGDAAVQATNFLVAIWFALFSIPFFRSVRERPRPGALPPSGIVAEGIRRVRWTVRHLRHYRETAILLLARLFYNDGLVTVFAFAAIFAAATFGMTTQDIIVLGIALNVTAGIGSFAFGWLDDRIGGKRTIMITLVVLSVCTIGGAMAQSRTAFWIWALLLGTMVGPNQAASRSLLARFIPPDREAEFFGFFAFSGKLASLLGPLTYGAVLQSTGSQRLAMGSILLYFVIGLAILAFVDEKTGRLARLESIKPGGRQE